MSFSGPCGINCKDKNKNANNVYRELKSCHHLHFITRLNQGRHTSPVIPEPMYKGHSACHGTRVRVFKTQEKKAKRKPKRIFF